MRENLKNYAMQDSELNRLKNEVQSLRSKNDDLKYENRLLRNEVYELQSDLFETEEVPFDITSLPNLMKWEKLCDNWDHITLEDIEAICVK